MLNVTEFMVNASPAKKVRTTNAMGDQGRDLSVSSRDSDQRLSQGVIKPFSTGSASPCCLRDEIARP